MLNQVQLIGNLGADPESRSFQNGGQVTNLRIACTEKWRDKNTGEKQERTEWVSVAIYNENLAKLAKEYLSKGSKVFLSGKLRTRKWQDQSGQDRWTTEVVLQGYDAQLIFLDTKRRNDDDVIDDRDRGRRDDRQGDRYARDDRRANDHNDRRTHAPSGRRYSDLDDEIPF